MQREKDYENGISEFWLFVWEVAKIVIVSLIIILPIRYWVAQPFFVKGASMEENFHNGDYLIVNEIGYRFHKPARGEVVIFHFPQDTSQFFIKRIIGLPGETLEIKDSKVTIFNADHPAGSILDESEYIPASMRTPGNLRVKLNEDEFFVLGDNRQHSFDSEDWGPLKKSFLVGRAWLRLWPPGAIGFIEEEQYRAP